MVNKREEAFLRSIATRLGRSQPLTKAPSRHNIGIQGLLDEDNSLSRANLVEQFIENWTALRGTTGILKKEDIPERIHQLVEEHHADQVVGWQVPELDNYGVPEAVASAGAAYRAWTHHDDISAFTEQADIGITTCDFAIAETGTLALFASPEKGRSVSLMPPVHVTFVPIERLVPRVTHVFQQACLRGMPSSLNFITGPSRTSDIEMVLTVGVHGPGKVYAYIVE